MREFSTNLLTNGKDAGSAFCSAFLLSTVATAAHQVVAGILTQPLSSAVAQSMSKKSDTKQERQDRAKKMGLLVANFLGGLGAIAVAMRYAQDQDTSTLKYTASCVGVLASAKLYTKLIDTNRTPLEMLNQAGDTVNAKLSRTKIAPAT